MAAPAGNPDEVLAKSAETTLTRGDWNADLTRIPAPNREGFASDPKRVESTLNAILVAKTFAARARAAGLDKDPVLQRRIEIEADRVLMARWIEKIEADAGAEFDRNVDASTRRAREMYLLDKKKYDISDQVDAWHILFTPGKHGGNDGALAAAKDARAKLAAGADFATLAQESSDDPSVRNNGGHLGYFPRGVTDKDFEKVAFAMKDGQLSEPVHTQFGWHIIRVDGHKAGQARTFDDVKLGIIAELREKYIREAREAAVLSVRSDPKLVVNQEAVESLVTTVAVPKELMAPADTSAPAKATK
jgi:hypothetical protein